MKTLSVYRPFAMERALNDFSRYMDDVLGERPFDVSLNRKEWMPAVDLKETGDTYTLEAELPGMEEKDIALHVEGDILTISSKHEDDGAKNVSPGKEKDKKDDENYIIRERRSVSFSRSFELPENADPDSISARFKNGLLTVSIKKRPESKKRQIEIGINQ
ncbi:MAG: Hsp20/alpha crystallin family protein [Spirochaetaceae bacterium]|nr:Hsp20/alpha crystallin family protein [Spirochaetaceae bacterium]